MNISILILLLGFILPPNRHDFHTSLAEIHYNQKNQTLEVSLRVFTDDLEAALAKENAGKVIKVNDTPAADPFISSYLARHFLVLDGLQGDKRPVAVLGKEISVDVTWIYFEVSQVENLTGKRLQNSVFMELFKDQINMVNFKLPSGTRSYLFNTGDPVQEIGS